MSGGKKKPKNRAGNYFMSVHYGVGEEVDELNAVWVNEVKVPGVGPVYNNKDGNPKIVGISQPNLFGGNSKSGGITGVMDVLFGEPKQLVTEALAQRLGLPRRQSPAFRGTTSLFFHNSPQHGGVRGFQWSTNQPVLPAVWATVTRYPQGVEGKSPTDGLGNVVPAVIIYEALSNTQWGMGCPLGLIDAQSFEYAKNVLINEGFWMSLMWARSETIENFIGEILDHIQASLVTHPATGKLTLKLLRNDYDRNNLRLVHPGNAKITKMQRKVWGETVNEVSVTWTNPENEQEETVTAQDNGNVAIQGAVISTTRNYYGIRNPNKAMELAMRDLRQSATPLLAIDATVQREFWDAIVGECVEVRWPEYGLGSIVMRIGSINYGKPGDTDIQISLLEDIFSFGAAVWSFDLPPAPKPGDRPAPLPPPRPGVVIPEAPKPVPRPPQGSEWVPPVTEPVQADQFFLTTAPFFMLAQEYGDDALRATPFPAGQVCQAMANRGSDVFAYNFWSNEADVNGVTEMVSQGRMLPDTWARTVRPVGKFDSVLTFLDSAMMGPPIQTGMLLFLYKPWVGTSGTDPVQEICAVLAVNKTGNGTTEVTVNRSCLDTLPQAWPANTPCWCIAADGDSLEPVVRADMEVVTAKFQPVNQAGTLPLESLALLSLTVTDRMHLPYRPANVKVDGLSDPEESHVIGGDITVTWANRNRWEESGRILAWTDGTVNPELGQFTVVELWQGSTMLSQSNIPAFDPATPAPTEWTFTRPTELPADGKLKVVIYSARYSEIAGFDLESPRNNITITVKQLPGYGNSYGQDYGGTL